MYKCTVGLSRQFLEVFACAGQVTCVVIFWCTPAGKMRPKMAKMRPKRAKRSPQEGQDEAQEGQEEAQEGEDEAQQGQEEARGPR